jgi:hypothetical protein
MTPRCTTSINKPTSNQKKNLDPYGVLFEGQDLANLLILPCHILWLTSQNHDAQINHNWMQIDMQSAIGS